MLNFALVGCGRIATRHAEILGEGQVERARLAAVCDKQGERARAFGKQFGVPYFNDADEMLHEMREQSTSYDLSRTADSTPPTASGWLRTASTSWSRSRWRSRSATPTP